MCPLPASWVWTLIAPVPRTSRCRPGLHQHPGEPGPLPARPSPPCQQGLGSLQGCSPVTSPDPLDLQTALLLGPGLPCGLYADGIRQKEITEIHIYPALHDPGHSSLLESVWRFSQ